MQFDTAIPIGEGGTGRVLKVYDHSRGQHVTVKLLERGQTERLTREADTQRRLDHPHICPVFEVGRHDVTPCIVMRYIDGAQITDALAHEPLDKRLQVFIQVLEAVEYAHDHGVVHRDLKPANILVERCRDGSYHAWLVDFGMAKAVDDTTLTLQGEAFGTPGYMAPEQAMGEKDIDERADIFSLGAVLFEVICGQAPFSGESAAQVLLSTVNQDAPSLRSMAPGAPARLTRIVGQCLERRPAFRYQAVRDLRADLQAFLQGQDVKARRSGPWYRARRLTAANPGATLAVGGLVGVALILALVVLWTDMAGDRFAADQAALAGQFSDQARRIESQADLIHARPLHDASAKRRSLAQELRQLSERVPDYGPARTTALLALGRAWSAIGDYDAALEHLQAAGRSTGASQGDDPIYGLLGRTYARLYFAAEDRALTLSDPELRASELEAARQSWLAPAIPHLRRATGPAAERPLLNRALIAWLEGDRDTALATLQEAAEMTNWPVEPMMLMGRIHLTAARSSEIEGNLESALDHYSAAHEVFRDVSELARSFPEAFRADCRTAASLANLELQGAEPDPELFQQARAACEYAVASDSTNPHSLLSAANTYERVAVTVNARREDPRPWIDKASALAERAKALAGNNPDTFRLLASLNLTTARWRLAEDVVSTLEQAVQFADRAVALDGGRPESLTVLASGHSSLARALYLRGGDGDEYFDEAVRALERAMAVSPNPVRVRARLAEDLAWQGYYRYLRGKRAGQTLERAVQTGRRAVKEAPDHIEAWISLAYAAWTLADYWYLLGNADGTIAQEAYRAYSRVLEIDPDRFSSRYNMHGPITILAKLRLSEGHSVHDLLAEKRALAESLQEDVGDQADLKLLFADVRMLEAWQAHLDGRIDQALEQLAESRGGAISALDGIDKLEAAQLLAEMALLEYRWRIDAGLEIASLDKEIELLADLTRQNPDLHRLHARLGELHLLAAKAFPERQSEHMTAAASILADALKNNPLLRSRHASSLDRALAATANF